MNEKLHLKAFIATGESSCDECGEPLGRSAWITLAGPDRLQKTSALSKSKVNQNDPFASSAVLLDGRFPAYSVVGAAIFSAQA